MNKLLIGTLAIAGLLLPRLPVQAEADTTIKSVQFKEKKVMIIRNSGTQPATNTVELPEAIKVMTNGMFTVKGGKQRQLRESQALGADGRLTSPDGTVVPVADHVEMKKGRLMLVKDGESSPATGEVVLGDGRRVKPDGTVTTTEGRIQRMLDGQIYKFDGETIASTDTATLIKGVVVLQKDGGRIKLRPDQKMAMSDGTQVFGDGTVMRPDGGKARLAEGEIFKLPGVEKLNR